VPPPVTEGCLATYFATVLRSRPACGQSRTSTTLLPRARRGVRAARFDYADANEVFPTRGASGLPDHSRADTRRALRRLHVTLGSASECWSTAMRDHQAKEPVVRVADLTTKRS
jgi:hypothetical protein